MTEEELKRLEELCNEVTPKESHLLNDFVILEQCLTPTDTTPNGFYLKGLAKHVVILHAEVRRLREALRFYADGIHYSHDGSPILYDDGALAIEALEGK